MQSSDFDGFSEVLEAVFELYNRPISGFATQIWWEALKPFDLPAVRVALSRHVQSPDTGQFPPKPADVIRMLGGTTQDTALRAWAKVDKAVRQVGTYASVAFDDALIHRVLHDMGGWVGLGLKAEDEWPFVAREFENRYRGYAMRGDLPEYPPVLIGLSGADNATRGHQVEPTRLIGDADKARAVMSGGTTKPLIGFSVGDALPTAQGLRLVGKESA